jgi:excisionase family DNA binding protein
VCDPSRVGRDRTNETLVSLHQAANRLGLAPRRLRAAVRDGELPAFQPGRRTRYVLWPDVVRWLQSQRVASSNHARERVSEILKGKAAQGQGP